MFPWLPFSKLESLYKTQGDSNLAVAALIAGYTRRNTIIDHDCAMAAIADHTAE